MLVREHFVMIDFHVFVVILGMFLVKEVIMDEKELESFISLLL
jgi:hypothetical protein